MAAAAPPALELRDRVEKELLAELTPTRLEHLWHALKPGSEGEKLRPAVLRRALSEVICEHGAKFAQALIQIFTFGAAATKTISDRMRLPDVKQKSDIVERRIANIAIRLLFSHRSKQGAPAHYIEAVAIELGHATALPASPHSSVTVDKKAESDGLERMLAGVDAIADAVAPPSVLLHLEAAAAITKGAAAVDVMLSELGAAPQAAAAGAGAKRPRESADGDAEPGNGASATDVASVANLLNAHRHAFAGTYPARFEGITSTILELRRKAIAVSDGMRALSTALQQAQKSTKGGDDPREDIIRKCIIAYLKKEKPKAEKQSKAPQSRPPLPGAAGAPMAAAAAPVYLGAVGYVGAPAFMMSPAAPQMPLAPPQAMHAPPAFHVPAAAQAACVPPAYAAAYAAPAPTAAPAAYATAMPVAAAPAAAAAWASPAASGPAAATAATPAQDDLDLFGVLSTAFGIGRGAYDAILRGQ